ncbi:MAG TPA: LON peptidase substrate-binding domain-containing protein, partial [Thermoanaerobaculia bacterium]|nr:LON peptidase substrate-binding domain-containing protein [Thermoanaerobaculia bacterium]
MSPMKLDLRIPDFPTTLLLLPLEQLLLLPQTALPVTLTDPLSQSILDAALAGEELVGVLQERGAGGGFYSVGCLCHVIDLGRSEEGHRVVLEGLVRFRILAELPPEADGIPRAAVSYEEFAGDLEAGEEEPPELNLDLLKEKIVEFGRKNFGTAGILESMSPRQVVLFMAQTAPFTPAEKQALLEASGLRDLVGRLTQL